MRIFEQLAVVFGERQAAQKAVEALDNPTPEQTKKVMEENGFFPYHDEPIQYQVNGEDTVTQLYCRPLRAKAVYHFRDKEMKTMVRIVVADQNPRGNSREAQSIREGKAKPHHIMWCWIEEFGNRKWLAKADWRFGVSLQADGRWIEIERDTRIVHIARAHMDAPEGFTGVEWPKDEKPKPSRSRSRASSRNKGK